MEIKVNDYVRIKKGRIGKVLSIKDDPRFKFEKYTLDIKYWNGNIRCSEEQIIKSNPNIGKLLKIGDFIDGLPIVAIDDTTIHALGGWFIHVDDVEDLVTSIVTKEQFEKMEYKINE